MRKFKTGTKQEVLNLMVRFAIRDQLSLLEALNPQFSEPDESTKIAIEETKNTIRDFRLIAAQWKKEDR